jgi:hypothetical protein
VAVPENDVQIDCTIDALLLDRDRTMDCSTYNPGPVPARGVDKLATTLWATGNQKLKDELDIPGLVEARHYWEELYQCDIETVYSSYEGDRITKKGHPKPSRKEGVKTVRDLYDPQDRVVVVDDIDLSGIDGVEHYFPEEVVRNSESR